MNTNHHLIIKSERLTLIPFTTKICNELLNQEYNSIIELSLKRGINWPDEEILETLPRIIKNLDKVGIPTGFESWMIIKTDTKEIIGDVGFKGFNRITNSADIGYGIIEAERRKGYAEEACKALINWAFISNDLQHITASCLIDNIGSANLLKKLNFECIAEEEEMFFWERNKNTEE